MPGELSVASGKKRELLQVALTPVRSEFDGSCLGSTRLAAALGPPLLGPANDLAHLFAILGVSKSKRNSTSSFKMQLDALPTN